MKVSRPTMLYVFLGLLILAVAFDAWGTWQNNRVLLGRDFNRLYAEHEQHHREHAEILRRCGR